MAKTPEKAPEPTKDAPAIVATDLSPWGPVNAEDLATGETPRDVFYAQGYSDERTRFEQELRDSGGKRATPLKYRFQYVTTVHGSGKPDMGKVSWYKARGYIPVAYDSAKNFGLDAEGSTFVKGPDGNCYVGSQLLMVAPREKVAVHAHQLAELNRRRAGAPLAQMEQAAAEFNQRRAGIGTAAIDFEETEFKERETR